MSNRIGAPAMESMPRPQTLSGLAQVLHDERGALLRFLAARCGSADEAEDLLQDLWLKVAGPGCAQPAGPLGNPRAYLFRMANNLVLDAARARQRAMRRDHAWLGEEGSGTASAPEDRPDPAPPADEAIERAQEAAMLSGAIAALPPGAARALRLFRLDGLRQDEIARVMGISRSGVEKHLSLAMRHLRASLADCGFFEGAASSVQRQTSGGKPRKEQGR